MANPTDKIISLPLFHLSAEGSGEKPNKKLKGNGFGRTVAGAKRATDAVKAVSCVSQGHAR